MKWNVKEFENVLIVWHNNHMEFNGLWDMLFIPIIIRSKFLHIRFNVGIQSEWISWATSVRIEELVFLGKFELS